MVASRGFGFNVSRFAFILFMWRDVVLFFPLVGAWCWWAHAKGRNFALYIIPHTAIEAIQGLNIHGGGIRPPFGKMHSKNGTFPHHVPI